MNKFRLRTKPKTPERKQIEEKILYIDDCIDAIYDFEGTVKNFVFNLKDMIWKEYLSIKEQEDRDIIEYGFCDAPLPTFANINDFEEKVFIKRGEVLYIKLEPLEEFNKRLQKYNKSLNEYNLWYEQNTPEIKAEIERREKIVKHRRQNKDRINALKREIAKLQKDV